MKLQIFFTASLLVELACTAPTSNNNNNNTSSLVITEDIYTNFTVVYTAEHDVVNILIPINRLNKDIKLNTIAFFIEADISADGERVDHGLSMLNNSHATKLLDNARDIAANNIDTNTAYFATKDGIYWYNDEKKQAEKYGTVTDSLISIAKVNGSDIIYALTEDHVLYKVTKAGTKKEKVDQVVNAKQIVLDYQNNLYYYTTGNEIYVFVGDTVKKINDLPENPTSVSLLKPPFVMESSIPVIINNKGYFIYANGDIRFLNFELEAKPTAYSLEATLIQYYAYNKTVYKFDLIDAMYRYYEIAH